ncbi:MAG: hypothetical protein WKF80_06270 [Thermomicrobiales bacterium]
MPIGFDPGDFGGGNGGSGGDPTDWRPGTPYSPGQGQAHDPVADLRARLDPWAAPEPVETGIWAWVEVELATVYPVRFEVWLVAPDERLCPECAPLGGAVWEAGAGRVPPLHPNCRCLRAHHHTEWRTRYASAWELRWVSW